eukprot:1993970-Rhodomonas_salina.1
MAPKSPSKQCVTRPPLSRPFALCRPRSLCSTLTSAWLQCGSTCQLWTSHLECSYTSVLEGVTAVFFRQRGGMIQAGLTTISGRLFPETRQLDLDAETGNDELTITSEPNFPPSRPALSVLHRG